VPPPPSTSLPRCSVLSGWAAAVWKLLPAVEKVLPFSLISGEGSALAEWANLARAVGEGLIFQGLYQSWPPVAPLDLCSSLTPTPHPDCPICFRPPSQLTPQGRTGCLLRTAESTLKPGSSDR